MVIAQLTRPSLVLVYALLGAGVAIFLRAGVMARALYVPAVVLVANLLSSLIKRIVGRERPPLEVQLLYEVNPAFPSGHATGVAALATAVTILALTSSARRGWWALAAVLSWFMAIASGVGRVYLGVHWPTDVLAGWLLGAVVAILGAGVAYGCRRQATKLT